MIPSKHPAASVWAKVFVINLAHRRDRWQFMQEQLFHRAQLPHALVERVPAIRGSDVQLNKLNVCGILSNLGLRRLQEPPAHRVWGLDLNPAAVGCALSHLQLWARIAAEGGAATSLPYLVCEDDSLFPNNFVELYTDRLPHVPADWQLLYISGLDTAGQCPQLSVRPGVCRVPQLHRTTNAYVVTAAGATELLRMCVPFSFQIDTTMTMCVGTAAGDGGGPAYVLNPRSYTLRPPLVVQATRYDSDIQQPDKTAAALQEEEAARCREAGWSTPPPASAGKE